MSNNTLSIISIILSLAAIGLSAAALKGPTKSPQFTQLEIRAGSDISNPVSAAVAEAYQGPTPAALPQPRGSARPDRR